MNNGIDVKDYYRRITEQDIGAVAKELLAERITQETSHTLMCDCPNHRSQSKRSLHVMLDKQGWYCFGCGVGGDVLQLVEFIQSETVTSGHSGTMPESHKQARDFLAAKIGLPPLSEFGLTPEELEKHEKMRKFEERVKLALTELAKLYHARLKANPEALAWLKENYALCEESIDKYLIGYADNTEGSWRILVKSENRFSAKELVASGAFIITREERLMPFFRKRLVFPYWSKGSVAFMIGRRTPWTEDNQYEQMKYKKLPVYDEEKHKYVAPFINNSVLFNEDCLLSKPERVIITEGVTDCLSLMQAGFPSISPATVRFRKEDWSRIIPKLCGVKKVYICQDNEMSEAGIKGALQTAKILSENNIDIRLITLPLGEKQLSSRKELEEKFNCKSGIVPSELKKLLQAMPETERGVFEKLLADAKTDVNEYFITGHSKDDFETLIEKSLTPLEFAINSIPDNISEEERNRKLEVVFEKIAWVAPVEQGRMLRLLRERWKNLSMAEMREQLRISQKKRKAESSAKKIKKIIQREYPKDSGKPMIELPYPPVKIDGVVIPGRTDAEFTHDLFTALAHLKAFYNYAGNIVQISELKRKDYRTGHEQQITGFDNVKPAGFVVDVEKYADLGIYMTDETDEKVFVKSSLKRCPAENALTSVAAKTLLPKINGITKIRLPYIYENELKFTPPGFDVNTSLWTDTLAPEVVTIPLENAKRIIHGVFSEFCFLEKELDIARALAYLLTPMLRAIIGPNRAMVFLASGNRPGVGKDYLLGLAPLIYTGEEQPFCAPCNDDDEYRKQIFSICAAGEQFFLISNLKGHLSSPALEQAASLPFFSGRTLGKSEQRTYPNLAVYGLSANGLTISEDMERRILDIRLEFYEEKIKDRKFKQSNLHEYMKNNRAEILSALYSLIIHWYKSGAPDGESKIPNFSEWSRLISGILPVCGFMNPFNERKKITASMQGSGNRDDDNLRSLCIQWYKRYGCGNVDAGALRNIAEENGLFQYLDFSERKHQVGFSKILTSRANRHYAGLKIGADLSGKHNRYYLEIIDHEKYKDDAELELND